MGTSMCVPRKGRDDHPLAYFGIPVSTLVVYEQRAVSQSTNYIPSVPVLLQDIAFYWDTQHESNYTGGDKSGSSSPSAVSPDSIWIASAEKAINDFAKKSKLLSLDKRVRVEKKNNSRAEKSSGRRANRVFEKPFRTLFAKTPIRAPHFVALLTLFLRKLPEPLLPTLFVRQMEEILLNSNMSETARSQALQKVDRQSFNSNYAPEHATFQYLKQLVQRHRAELIAAEVEVLVRAMLRESNECVVEFMIHQVRPLVNPVIHASMRETSVESNNGHGKSNNNSSNSNSNNNNRKNIESVSNVQMDAVSVESNEKKTSEAGSVLYSSASSHHSEPQEKAADNKGTPSQSEASVFTSSDDSSETKKDRQERMERSKEELDNEEKGMAAPAARTRRGSTTSTNTTNTTTTNTTTIGERSQNAGVVPPLTRMECVYSTESPESSASEEEKSNKSIISSIHDENNDDDEFDHDVDDNNKKNSDESCSKVRPVTTERDEEASDVVMIKPGDGEYNKGISIRQCEEKHLKKEHTSQMKENETTQLSETGKIDSASSVVGSKQSMVKKNKQQETERSKNHIATAAAVAAATGVTDDDDDSNNYNDVTDEYEDEKKNENVDRSKFIKKVDRSTSCTEMDVDAVLPEVNSSTQSFPKQNSFHHDRYVAPIKNGKEQMMRATPVSLKEYSSQSERKTLEFPNSSYTSQPVLNSFPYREKETHSTVTGGRRFAEEHPRHAALLLAKQIFLGKDYLPPTRLQLNSKTSELTLSSDVKNTIKDESNAYPLSQFSESDKPPSGNTVDEPVFMSEENAFSFPQREQQLQLQQQESQNEQLRNPVIQSLLTKVEELNTQCNSLAQLVSSKMTSTTEPHQDQKMKITKEVEEKMLFLKDVVRQVAECHSATVEDVLKLQQQVIQQQQELESVLAENQNWRNDAIRAKEAALEMQLRCANVETAQLEGKQQLQYMSAVLKDLAYKLECGEKENLDLKVEIAALQRQSILLREKLLSSP